MPWRYPTIRRTSEASNRSSHTRQVAGLMGVSSTWERVRVSCRVDISHHSASNLVSSSRRTGTDRVLGPGQIRPYHTRLTHPEIRDYYVTERTFAVLTNPFDAARTMYLVGDHAYATLGVCS